MAEIKYYSLQQLLDRLALPYDENRGRMPCFVCGKKKMNLDFENNRYRCPICGESGGVLHLYAVMQLGIAREAFPSKSDKDGIAKIREKLCEFMDGGNVAPQSRPKPKGPVKPSRPRASDDVLDSVYSRMQRIPALQLTDKHRSELLRRGLDRAAIERNGYLSIPDSLHTSAQYEEMYEYEGGEQRRKLMSWISPSQITFGLMIADSIISQGLDPKGVPGFFKFGERWCFWSIPGILIPTRNLQGQIVLWQVRRDVVYRKDDAKYLTVGSASLPEHTNANISRCHFPLGNAEISTDVPLLITEGPLKADIACHLYGCDVSFAAIHGINNTEDLYSYIRTFRKRGINTIYNAFDMDRFTNHHVREGLQKIAATFAKRRISFQHMCWGNEFAESRLLLCMDIARRRNVRVSFPSDPGIRLSVFERLDIVAAALHKSGINPFLYHNAAGEECKFYWDPATKGIDDYLASKNLNNA